MIKKILLGVVILLVLSCNKNDDIVTDSIKQGKGNIWLSGGLYHCTEQIHLDKGEILIVTIEEIVSFKSGDRVSVKYKEIGVNEFCSPGIDCEIIEMIKVE